jgi:hypothetical protein
MTNFHNEYVRRFQLDLVDASKGTDARTERALRSAANLAGTMIDPARYAVAAEEFARS